MKKNFRVSAFIFMLSLSLFLPPLNADIKPPFTESEPNISMDLQDANLKDVLKIFSMQSGLNFIASEAIQDRKITLYLDQVPLKKAMDKLFKANNLSYDLDSEAKIFIIKDWGKVQIETETRVFLLKYATVSSSPLREEVSRSMASTETSGSASTTSSSTSSSSTGSSSDTSGTTGTGTGSSSGSEGGITKAVEKLLSSVGSVIEDFRTNSLIVTDSPERLAVIAKVIAQLDVPVPQVLLEVEMLDVSRNNVDRLGFNYGTTPFTAVLTGASATAGFPFGNWTKLMDAGKGSLAINTGSNTYQMSLDFLRSQTDTRFLARPKLLTLSNETAEIEIATNEAIGVTQTTSAAGGSAGQITASAERSHTGVLLRVTPQVNVDTGEITMFIYPKVAEATASSVTSSLGSFRDPEERSTKTMVRIKDGDTVVIGGLIRNELLKQETKLPILGDLPFIGALFRHIGGTNSAPDKDRQRELLVFITPRIIKETTDIRLAQTSKVTLPEREQNTLSRVGRELEITSSLNRFEKK